MFLIGIVARFLLSEPVFDAGAYYVNVPDETPGYRAVEIYACPVCEEEIYAAYPDRRDSEEARQVLSTLRLLYEKPSENGLCPNHPDQQLTQTTEFPVQPQVKFALPEDTEYISRYYLQKDPNQQQGRRATEMTIVISSRDRRSIHRAESCLTSQGWHPRTQKTRYLQCASAPDGALSVRALLMNKPGTTPEGQSYTRQLVVLYWYAALPARLTSSEYRRLALTLYDRLVRGKNYRWSYVLVTREFYPGESPLQVTRQLEQFAKEFTDGINTTVGSQ